MRSVPRMNASRTALVLAASALLIAATGVTPSDAARAVARALNADKVDGISASRTPKAGQLLALGRDRRFPSSVLPQSAGRGPRGPEGPSGSVGATGPSDAYIARNVFTSAPFGAPVVVLELRLAPGAYALDFAGHALAMQGQNYIDCQVTANGQQLVKTAALIGDTAPATTEGALSMTDAARLETATVLRVLCSARGPGSVNVYDGRLRAIRLGSLTEQ